MWLSCHELVCQLSETVGVVQRLGIVGQVGRVCQHPESCHTLCPQCCSKLVPFGLYVSELPTVTGSLPSSSCYCRLVVVRFVTLGATPVVVVGLVVELVRFCRVLHLRF